MGPRAASSPVQVVARAARFRMLRNTLVAMGAVVMTAVAVTALLVWPVAQHTRAGCADDQKLVSVRPYTVFLDMTGMWTPLLSADGSDHRGAADQSVEPSDPDDQLAGCVDKVDLTPETPPADGRG